MKKLIIYFLSFCLLTPFTGCDKATYPDTKVAESIKEICRKEYKIQEVDVKFAGRTIGVFLPLKKLFTTDVRQELLSGNVANLESLFEPEPEAIDQLENVLFTISRVLLSSDRDINFYVLQATDIESTGLQLVLMGYVDDVRRLRIWDIPRSEYRKRVLHELKFNRSVLWEGPVRQFFENVGKTSMEDLKQYFSVPMTAEMISPILFHFLQTVGHKDNLKIEFNEVKSRSYKDTQSLIYVKLTETYEKRPNVEEGVYLYPSPSTFEYIFVVEPTEKQFKISQVIPFHFIDETKSLKKVPLPPQLDLDRNLDSWPERFSLEEIAVGDFLARQLNRRVQSILLGDERIHHTMRHAQINFDYRNDPKILSGREPFFSLYFDFITKGMKTGVKSIEEIMADEDVLYLLNLVLKEFTDLVRSYRFGDYDFLELIWEPGGTGAVLKLSQDRLDLFRQKKLDISGLLETTAHSLIAT